MKLINAISLTCAVIAFQTTVILPAFSSDTWPLGNAIRTNNKRALAHLLDSETDPNQTAPEHWSTERIKEGRSSDYNLFFIPGLEARPENWTALMEAARAGNLQATKMLLSRGADPAIENEEGNTALMEALRRHKINVAMELMDQGVTLTAAQRAALLGKAHLADLALEATQPKREQRKAQIIEALKRTTPQPIGPDVEQLILDFADTP